MNNYLKKFIFTKTEPTKQVVDLLLFLAYFSISLYAGGFAYSLSYYSRFEIDVSSLFSPQQYIILFVTRIILTSIYISFITFSLLLILIILYYSARNIWRPWFGFLILVLMFCGTFTLCIWLGNNGGSIDAERDRMKQTTTLPTIKLTIENSNTYSGGDYCLLLQTDEEVYLYKPETMAESTSELSIISKRNIKTMEVTVK